MGLDQYLYRRKKVKCPHCGTMVIPELADYNGWGESLYWRKWYGFHNFISNEIAPNGYGDDMYAKDLPLTVEDLEKIREYIVRYNKQQGDEDPEDNSDIRELDSLIRDMREDPTVYAAYNADW